MNLLHCSGFKIIRQTWFSQHWATCTNIPNLNHPSRFFFIWNNHIKDYYAYKIKVKILKYYFGILFGKKKWSRGESDQSVHGASQLQKCWHNNSMTFVVCCDHHPVALDVRKTCLTFPGGGEKRTNKSF